MYRTEKLIIRLNKVERAAIHRLARMERLPVSTMARRLLLAEADERGLLPAHDQHAPAQVGQEEVQQ